MRPLCILAALSLAGCPGPPPPPPAPASASTPSAGPTPAPQAASTPAPAAVPATLGQPWVMQRDRGAHLYLDGFSFLGWSADGARYAFAVSEETQGADCGAKHSLFVVNASADAFAPKGTAVIKHDSPEGGPDGCSPRDLAPLVTAARAELLGRHGIEEGFLVAPVLVSPKGQSGLLAAGSLVFAFAVQHDAGDDLYGEAAQAGAAYTLTLAPGEPGVRNIEPGTRRRPYVLRYVLDGNPVFVSPDGAHAAVVIGRVHTAHEGSRLSWMTNGLAL